LTRPVVFVHGAFCGGWAFDGFRKPFEAAGYETHAPDLPHHERGSDLDCLAQTGVRDYSDAIVHFVRALPSPPILVGHSLGGLIAQMAAMRVDVAGLILIGSSPPWGVTPTTLDEAANAFGVAMLGDFWRRPIAPDYAIARRTTIDRLPRDEARGVFAKFVPESGRVVAETVHWWLDHTMSSAAPVYRIAAPVLAIAGSKDHVNPPTTLRRLVNRFPSSQADFIEFSEMSHWLIGEPEWPDVAAAALDWLRSRGLEAKGSTAPKRRRVGVFPWSAAPGA
jgi:pimeloyl-ACP methyl ester carboxylesterase